MAQPQLLKDLCTKYNLGSCTGALYSQGPNVRNPLDCTSAIPSSGPNYSGIAVFCSGSTMAVNGFTGSGNTYSWQQ